MSRKKRKSPIDWLFGGSAFEDFGELFEDFEKDRGDKAAIP